MKRSSRLAAIARVQQHREQHQRLILLEARQQLDKQQALLKQLEDYRAEYLNLHSVKGRRSSSLPALSNASRFVDSLSQAIKQQGEQEANAAEIWARENQQWQILSARGDAMDNLVDECHREEQRQGKSAEDQEAEELWGVARLYSR